MAHASIETLISNARRLGHGSHVVAAAAAFLKLEARSVCVWCAESIPGTAARLPAGGECERCPYVGRDCIVVYPEVVS